MREMSYVSLRGTLEGHTNWVTDLDYDAEHETLISASRDKRLIVWDMSDARGDDAGIAKKSLVGHHHFVSSAKFAANGEYAISSSWDKMVFIWNLATGAATKAIGHGADCLDAAIFGNSLVASASRDSTVRVWDIEGKELQTLGPEEHSGWVTALRFAPVSDAAQAIVAGTWSGRVVVWEQQSSGIQFSFAGQLKGHRAPVTALCVAPDGSLVASGAKDGRILVHDLATREVAFEFSTADGAAVNGLAFFEEHFWLAAAAQSGIEGFDLKKKVRFFARKVLTPGDVPPSDDERELEPRSPAPVCVCTLPDARLAVGAEDGVIYAYDVAAE